MSRVVSVKVSPLNARRWLLSLSCGHDVWITATRRPRRRSFSCVECLKTADRIPPGRDGAKARAESASEGDREVAPTATPLRSVSPEDGTPPKKIDELRRYMADGNWRAALKLAASFPRLGIHKEPISRGWEAYVRPRFYRGLGQDPKALVDAGIAALKERYA